MSIRQKSFISILCFVVVLLLPSCATRRGSLQIQEAEFAPIITEGLVTSVEVKKEEKQASEAKEEEEDHFLPVKNYQVTWNDDAKICLVLGPGMARGFAHAGVIEVLKKLEFPLHCIVGTEMGALVGGIYALRPDTNILNWELFKIKHSNYLDYPFFSIKKKISGKKIHDLLKSAIGSASLDEAKILFAVSVTNEHTGRPQALQEAMAANAISASIAISGLFKPWKLRDGSSYTSGTSSSPLPVKVARSLGATHVIVVNLLADDFLFLHQEREGAIAKEFAFARNISELQKKEADFLIEPNLSEFKFTDFHKRAAIIEEGKRSTLSMIEKVRRFMEDAE